MKIGMDFDDVIVDFFNPLLIWHNEKYSRKDVREEFNEFNWGTVWGISKEEAIRRVTEFHDYHKVEEIPPVEDAIDFVKELMKKNELTIITGRPMKYKHRVQEWLDFHLGKKIEVVIAGEFIKGQAATKAEICKELGIPVLFEDAPETAMNCAKAGIKVVLFDNPWNQGIKHKNIFRVYNWKEAMDVFKSLKI